MIVIGLTGGTGCGKTTALQAIAALGGLILDCDAIYHQLLQEDEALLAAISRRFPGTVEAGRLHRKRLGDLVFHDPAALRDLNALTHPAVKQKILEILAREKPALAAIDAIALWEGGLGELCQKTVAVTAPRAVRAGRLMAREGISMEYALSRIDAQKKNEAFAAKCDYVLENTGTPQAFLEDCLQLFRHIIEKENTTMENIREKLLFQPKHGYDRLTQNEREEMNAYCKEYAAFMDAAKTEREAVTWTVAQAERLGFRPLTPGAALKPGDKVYQNNRGKSILLAVIGEENLDKGVNICASHIDSPRLDIKPNPLFEEAEIAYLKTHYYGGIKKYQWVTIPLALHGVVSLKNGETITVTIGEAESDPVIYASDLLIHLSGDQMKKTAAEAITGEQMNLMLGTEPLSNDDGANRVKLAVLKLLNEKFGLVEEDFLSAELTVVPAGKCREVGLDRSMLGAYGHDDRVCAFASLYPLFRLGTPKKTAVCILADKEEIGSVGVSGMQSRCFETFMADLCAGEGANVHRCLENSFCLSADVTNAYDPNFGPRFGEVHDKQNNARLNYGVAIAKYTGSKGKSGASDASAEVMGYVRRLFDRYDVVWQTATLGRIDQGGGGTVAAYMANRNIDTVDAGVPVISMHSPWEVVAKLDCYMTMRAMDAVYGG